MSTTIELVISFDSVELSFDRIRSVTRARIDSRTSFGTKLPFKF